jgi:hypothetical protein
MSSNDNEIGTRAILDLSQFETGTKKLDAMIKSLDTNLSKFEKEQEKRAAAQVTAENKAADAVEKGAQKQEFSLRKLERAYKQAVTSIVVLFAGLVAAYKFLEDESKRLGDQETIAAYKGLEQSVTDLKDSFAAMVLSAVDVSSVLDFVKSGIVALTQVLTLSGAAVTWFGTLFAGTLDIIGKRLAEMKQGKIFTSGMDIGAEFTALNARANQAANNVIIAGAQAPGRVTATTAQADADKEAKKAQEQRLKDQADYAQKFKDLTIKSGEDILSAESDMREKSASAWSDYMQKSAEIVAEGIKKRAELLTTYTDAIRKAESDYQRGSEDASYEHGKKLADIARQYQDTVRQINEDYGKEALDAARNLDAIGFVRAKEKRDSALQDAARTRDEANTDENDNYSRQLYELQRSLEDKKREAEDAYQRGLDDQRRSEQEAQDSAKQHYNQQLSDAQRAFNDKLAAINASYANEDAAAQAHYLNEETAYAAHLAQMAALLASYGIGATGFTSGGGPRGRAQGGLDIVSSPTQFIAGEGNQPEMVLTMPLNRSVPMPIMQTVTHTGDFTHQIDSTIRSSVAGMDGRITAAITKVLREVLG